MLPKRKSTAIPHYDYSQPGAYFITLCVEKRRPILGKIDSSPQVVLSSIGKIVSDVWYSLPQRFPCLDAISQSIFVVVPDHIHGILQITAGGQAPPLPSIKYLAPLNLLQQLKPIACLEHQVKNSGNALPTNTSSAISRTSTRPPGISPKTQPGGWNGRNLSEEENRCRGSLDCLSSGGQRAVVYPSPNLLGCHRYGLGQNYRRVRLCY